MNYLDILILIAVVAACGWAVYSLKHDGKKCCGDCHSCAGSCSGKTR